MKKYFIVIVIFLCVIRYVFCYITGIRVKFPPKNRIQFRRLTLLRCKTSEILIYPYQVSGAKKVSPLNSNGIGSSTPWVLIRRT